MAASFPNSIAAFTTKRNLLDDVDASDINRLQEEIVAIESILGPLVLEVDDLRADIDENEAADQADEQKLTNTIITVNKTFKNLKERLDYLQEGLHIGYANLHARDQKIARSEKLDSSTRRVNFPRPSTANDPWKMYNGAGLTLPKPGLWILVANGRWDLGKGSAKKIDGYYEMGIDVNGNLAEGLDRTYCSGVTRYDAFLNCVRIGRFARGSRVFLRPCHTSDNATAFLQSASLSAYRIRG